MNNKWKWVYNPFEIIAGWEAFAIGIVTMALTAVFGKINHLAFSGVMDVNPGVTFSFVASFVMQAVNFLILFIVFLFAGILFSKSKTRAIDIAGTMALARAPLLLFVLLCFLPVVPENIFDLTRTVIFAIICMPFIVWIVALMYNAYAVSFHLNGIRAVLSFIGALLIAEIISKLVFFFLLSGLFTNTPILNIFEKKSAENTIVITDTLNIRQKTENVVSAFEQGKFDVITAYFDENMKKRLSSGSLRLLWLQTNLICGKFERADLEGIKETRIDNYDVIEVPFFFQKEKLMLRLAFNGNRKISGLSILKVE